MDELRARGDQVTTEVAPPVVDEGAGCEEDAA